MRRFQVLMLALLIAITIELGLIVVKLPTPAVHAGAYQQPAPALEDPHETLKRQITEVQRELAGDRQRLTAIEQQIARVSQNVQNVTQTEEKVLSRVNDDSKRLLVTCFMEASIFIKTVSGAGTTGAQSYCKSVGWTRQSGPSLAMDFDTPFGP